MDLSRLFGPLLEWGPHLGLFGQQVEITGPGIHPIRNQGCRRCIDQGLKGKGWIFEGQGTLDIDEADLQEPSSSDAWEIPFSAQSLEGSARHLEGDGRFIQGEP